MKKRTITGTISLLIALTAFAQQSNVNLSYNPQKDTEGLIPFSANLNSPQVNDDHTVERSDKPRTDANWLDTVRPGQYQAVNRRRGQR